MMPLPQSFIDACHESRFDSAREAEDWESISTTLNTRNQPIGWIAPRHILSVLLQTGSIGVIEWIHRFGTLPSDGTPRCPINLYCLVSSFMNSLAMKDYEFRPITANVSAGADVFIAAGLATNELKTAILAGEQLVGESYFLIGHDCDHQMVEEACS
jgi:hypothetical protein